MVHVATEAFPVFLLSLIHVNEKQTWINFVSCSVRTHWGQLSQVRYAAENGGNLTFIESHLTSGILELPQAYTSFACDVISAMLEADNKRFLISFYY